MAQVSDINIVKNVPLVTPSALMEEVPRTQAQAAFISKSRLDLQKILTGQDSRFLLIVGPCSIHDPKAGIEYAEKLAQLSKEVEDRIKIVMRVYFEKPRTTVGWKGLIMDPDLDGSDQIGKGLRQARELLCQVIDLGLATATELLDPITPQYIADLVSWSAIGARTSESQTHRQMASGLSMPLGFKNATSGDVVAALNAINAASRPQTFLGVSQEGVASAVSTKGNPFCHLILRGGENGPNFSASNIERYRADLEKHKLPPFLMIDASHANCGKDQTQMPGVFREIMAQRSGGDLSIIGAMLESNLVEGNQNLGNGDLDQLVYGKSVTDQCINWETTVELVREAYEQLGS